MRARAREIWRNEGLGLTMIAASLLVIAVILGLLFTHARELEDTRVRGQATSLVRLLAALPPETAAASMHSATLSALAHSQSKDELAYGVITDALGTTVAEIARPGVAVPPFDRAAQAASPDAVRIISSGRDELIEVAAPLDAAASPGGLVRLGYFRPRTPFAIDELPFLASLALAVFLLTPIFYFLARTETNPIRRVTTELAAHESGGPVTPLNTRTGGPVGAFVEHFNRFAETISSRLGSLEAENTRLLTSAKLSNYQRQRLERVLEALPDVVLLLDESSTVIFANGKLRGLLDVAPEDIVGRRPDEWCKDRKIVDFIQKSEGRVLSRQLAQTLEFTPEGMPSKVFAVRAFPLLAAQPAGSASAKLFVFRDVTTEHLAARSRGEFVGHLAHELKTPLNVLAMYSEQLQIGDPADETARVEAVNAINDEVHRLAALIDNLLNITRIEMGSLKLERQRVNVKDLLQDAFNHVARSGRDRGLKFVLEVPESLPAAALDKNLLRVALNNLLTNAIKYSHSGGTVTLGAEETDDALRIYVADNGIGIKPEDRERIFERFFRADDEQTRSRPGHGLGLSLARDIVHLHHGALRVESEVGKGSKFFIELWKDTMMLQQAS